MRRFVRAAVADRAAAWAPTQPPTWSVAGVVTDAVTGLGVPGATVAFADLPSATTNETGNWRMEGPGSAPSVAVFVANVTAPAHLSAPIRAASR